MITEFIQTYKNTISGRYDAKRSYVGTDTQGLSGGAKIKANFYQLYQEFDGVKACNDYSDDHIQKAI